MAQIAIRLRHQYQLRSVAHRAFCVSTESVAPASAWAIRCYIVHYAIPVFDVPAETLTPDSARSRIHFFNVGLYLTDVWNINDTARESVRDGSNRRTSESTPESVAF